MKVLVLVLAALSSPAVQPTPVVADVTAPPALACERLARSCDRCDTGTAREIDQLQVCARSLFEADEATCAAQIQPTRRVCR